MAILSIVIIFIMFGVSAPVYAAKFYCSSGDVTCLIAGINSANRIKGSHTISLEPGTYTLTRVDNETDGLNGLPSIVGKVTIHSDLPGGAIIQRDAGAPRFRIFHVGSGARVTLDALVITQGRNLYGGAGLLNLGTVNMINSVIESNVADEFGGGGIENRGTLTIKGSSIVNNSGLHRVGGISNDGGLVTIMDATISNNIGDRTGGVLNLSGEIIIANTTIANNSGVGVGGIRNALGLVRLTNTTIAGNSVFAVLAFPRTGGIANDVQNLDSMTLQNTILANNVGTVPPAGGPNCDGGFTSLGNNIFGDLGGCTVELKSTDILGDPHLGAFVDIDDPGLSHFPLLSDSPAIDAGDPSACPKTDQLDFFRVGSCDIGAVEFQLGPLNVGVSLQPNNRINLKSNGPVTVAILSSPSFDARAIDPQTVRFGPNQAFDIDGQGRFRDVSRDRLRDLILTFSAAEAGFQCGDSSISITGETFNGQAIQGSHSIQTVDCKLDHDRRGHERQNPVRDDRRS